MHQGRKTVLVVEDEVDLRNLLVQALEYDFNVVSAANGVAGLEAASQHRPDVIVCDYNMPVRNGLYTIAEVRRDPVLARVPIILMSGQRQPEASVHLNVTFLSKPFPLDSLFRALDEALSASQLVAA